MSDIAEQKLAILRRAALRGELSLSERIDPATGKLSYTLRVGPERGDYTVFFPPRAAPAAAPCLGEC